LVLENITGILRGSINSISTFTSHIRKLSDLAPTHAAKQINQS